MKARAGFTLIEVVVALMLLTTAVMSVQLVTATMLRRMSGSYVQLSAAQLAEDRIDRVRLEPNYNNLPSFALTESAIPGFPAYTRITQVVQTRDSSVLGVTDFRRITVTVNAPGLLAPVKRTLVIGAP